jgi:hypothetical protein
MCPTDHRRCWLFICSALLLTGAVSVLHAEETSREIELRQLLFQPVKFPGIDDPKVTFCEALETVAKRYHLSFDINEQAFKDADITEVHKIKIIAPGPIPEMHTRLETVLKKILGRVSPSAMYIIRGDIIEITTQDAERREFFPDRPTGPLPPLVSRSFDTVPLKSSFKQLAHAGNIVLDGRVAKEGETEVTADFSNVPLDTAVRMLADMAGLKVVPLENALYVTDKENARTLMEEQEKLRLQRQPEKKKADKPAADPNGRDSRSPPAKSKN